MASRSCSVSVSPTSTRRCHPRSTAWWSSTTGPRRPQPDGGPHRYLRRRSATAHGCRGARRASLDAVTVRSRGMPAEDDADAPHPCSCPVHTSTARLVYTPSPDLPHRLPRPRCPRHVDQWRARRDRPRRHVRGREDGLARRLRPQPRLVPAAYCSSSPTSRWAARPASGCWPSPTNRTSSGSPRRGRGPRPCGPRGLSRSAPSTNSASPSCGCGARPTRRRRSK